MLRAPKTSTIFSHLVNGLSLSSVIVAIPLVLFTSPIPCKCSFGPKHSSTIDLVATILLALALLVAGVSAYQSRRPSSKHTKAHDRLRRLTPWLILMLSVASILVQIYAFSAVVDGYFDSMSEHRSGEVRF